MQVSEALRSAVRDYRAILDMGYTERGVQQLVADRYRLTREERTILYRGVFPSVESEQRLAKLWTGAHPLGGVVWVDGLNVLYTLVSYLTGRPLFVATDGWLRDAGERHGEKMREEHLARGWGLMTGGLSGVGDAVFICDASADAAVQIRSLAESGKSVRIDLTDNADETLALQTGGVVATSDSVVIDRATGPVIDLPRMILEREYDAVFVHLSSLM